MKLPKVYLRDLKSERLKSYPRGKLLGISEFLPQSYRIEAPHIHFEKDFNFYLNSSRAASSGEFKFK